MSFWKKNKTKTEVATIEQEPVKLTRVDDDVQENRASEMSIFELDQRIKDLMRRDGPKMSKWSPELHTALDQRRTQRQLSEMDAKLRLAKGELELGKLEVDRLHEKIDEDGLRMVRDGQTANVPKRRR